MIDPKQIEEWKIAALKEGCLRAMERTVHGTDAAELNPWFPRCEALLAERDSLLSLLREVEWSVVEKDSYGSTVSRHCPLCRLMHNHASDCRLAAALRGKP